MADLEEKALDAAKEYADLILKRPLSEFGGLLSDSIGYWRLKNRINLILKAKSLLDKSGLKPNQIDPSIFIPILEDGSMSEDKTLLGMFASVVC